MRPRPTIRLRLTLLYGALFLASGALLLGINYVFVERNLPEAVGFQVKGVKPGGAAPPGEGAVIRVVPLPGSSFRLPDGRVVSGPEALALLQDRVEVLERERVDLRARTLRTLVAWSLVALGVMAVAAVGLGWLMAGRVLAPLHAITATARRLGGSNLHERIRMRGPADELKELADTFDGMLDRLDEAFASQRRFVANASHELRTPLAIIRTELDVTLADPEATPEQLRAMAEVVREATERSERLIDSLLWLARSERELRAAEPVDLAEAAAEAAHHARREPAGQGLRVDVQLAPAPVAGDRALLERLAANLIENAVRHNVPGGWVHVATGSGGGRAWLRVANSGPPIPPAAVPGLFEPFRRLGTDRTRSRQGVGLGLSIVRAVATAHQGRVDAAALPEGGLVVLVSLPCRAEPLPPPAAAPSQRGELLRAV